jgi:predicted DCC family thiol-disulfide oxidoreductase YuxK
MELSRHPVVLYDGLCGLCNATVRWTIRLDGRRVFRFAALQSDAGAALLARHELNPRQRETVVVIADGRAFTRSDAALAVVARLPAPVRYLRYFRFVPRWLRDRAYDLVARHRAHWFGRLDTCPLPDPADRDRFLDRDERSGQPI